MDQTRVDKKFFKVSQKVEKSGKAPTETAEMWSE
jgi:hypothetical protein